MKLQEADFYKYVSSVGQYLSETEACEPDIDVVVYVYLFTSVLSRECPTGRPDSGHNLHNNDAQFVLQMDGNWL